MVSSYFVLRHFNSAPRVYVKLNKTNLKKARFNGEGLVEELLVEVLLDILDKDAGNTVVVVLRPAWNQEYKLRG